MYVCVCVRVCIHLCMYILLVFQDGGRRVGVSVQCPLDLPVMELYFENFSGGGLFFGKHLRFPHEGAGTATCL